MFCLTNFSLYVDDEICHYGDDDDLDYDILYDRFCALDNISDFPFLKLNCYKNKKFILKI